MTRWLTMRCSFCQRTHTEVDKLVAGPRRVFSAVYICDRCAAQAIGIMEAAGDRHAGEQAPGTESR